MLCTCCISLNNNLVVAVTVLILQVREWWPRGQMTCLRPHTVIPSNHFRRCCSSYLGNPLPVLRKVLREEKWFSSCQTFLLMTLWCGELSCEDHLDKTPPRRARAEVCINHGLSWACPSSAGHTLLGRTVLMGAVSVSRMVFQQMVPSVGGV